MSYYPTDKCFLCGNPMHRASEFLIYCVAPICHYEKKKYAFIFNLEVNDQMYEIHLYESDNSTVIERKLTDPEFEYEIIYDTDSILEMTVEQWIEFIQRIERLNAFK